MRKFIFAASLAALAGAGLSSSASARDYIAWGYHFYDASFHPQSQQNFDVASEGTEADTGRAVATMPVDRPLYL